MKPIHDAQPTPNLTEMTYGEIISHFQWLGFKDDIGHDLTSCNAFLLLVDLAVSREAKND